MTTLPLDRFVHVEHVMGMPVSIHVRGPQARVDPGVADAVRLVVADLHDVDATFSTYTADSPVSRIRRGELDLRRTLRRSMSTGGVPVRPAHRARRPGRPELVVLCDVSGSVAGFSHFTLLLVQALREQFAKVRVVAFVERADEVAK